MKILFVIIVSYLLLGWCSLKCGSEEEQLYDCTEADKKEVSQWMDKCLAEGWPPSSCTRNAQNLYCKPILNKCEPAVISDNPFRFCYPGSYKYESCIEDTLAGCMVEADGKDIDSPEFQEVYRKCYGYLQKHKDGEL